MVKINGREFDLDSIYIGDDVEKPEEVKAHVKEMLDKIFVQGMLPKDAMGMSDVMVEALYAHAYRLFNTGKFEDAILLFRFLIVLDPTEVKYALGMAACLQMQKDYKMAAAAYAFASSVDATNPMPFYYASDCYIRLGDLENAKSVLKKTIELSGEKPDFSMIKERAIFTLEGLENDKQDAKQPLPKTVNQ